MAISLETINVGVENQATGSDSLFTAFTKTQNNFTKLSTTASPFNTFNGGNGILTESHTSNGTVTITNSGVLNIIPGTGITASGSNGNVILSVSGSANGALVAGVTSVGINSTTLSVSNSPIISNGVMTVNLPTIGTVTPGSYVAPTVTIDQYGRITSISDTESTGTVTSVSVSAGDGIGVSGGPITNAGTITVTNTGVTRLNAGPGILLSGHTGELTISSSNPVAGTVTSVEVTSNTLVVTGGPITSAGTINIELPSNESLTGNFVAGNITASTKLLSLGTGNIVGAFVAGNTATFNGNVQINANANVTGLMTVTGNANVTGNITSSYFVGNGATLTKLTGSNVTGQVPNALVAGTVYACSQPNITSVGTLTSLNVTGNITSSGNLILTDTANVGNLSVVRNLTVGNSTVGNLSTFDVFASNTVTVANTGYLLLNTVTNNTKFVGFQAPSSIAGSYIIWQLPGSDGTANSFLSTNGAGVLSYKQPASSSAPATATSTGVAGQIAYDSTHIYVCIATNSWIRASAAAW